jgi:hypothetical protein
MKKIVSLTIVIAVLTVSASMIGYYWVNVASSSKPNITISYSYQMSPNISSFAVGQFGSAGMVHAPDLGNKYLEVNMTIENNGYTNGFDINGTCFSVLTDNSVICSFNDSYSIILGWGKPTITINNTTVPLTTAALNYSTLKDGEGYTGTLVFQIPQAANLITIEYQQPASENINIVWVKT